MTRKQAVIGIGGFFALILIVVILAVTGLGFRWVVAPFTGAVQEREIVQGSGQYRIQAYEQFYRWEEEVAAVDVKLAAYPETGLDVRQQTECRGLLARRANVVARYNAASRAERTQGQWQDPELPQTLQNASHGGCAA